jgi:adenosylcobinamide kinase/adenosylcobinamide-phosphate guanylyltransferase
MITLITGGARSGKSAYALKLALEYSNRVFIATAQAIDGEMEDRIAKHKAERGDSFTTIEEPVDLAGAIKNIPEGTEVALIDCLTVWMGNLMHKHGDDAESFQETSDLMDVLAQVPCDIILVSNEVGMGIVPDNQASRLYRDMAGRMNQEIAAIADSVILTVAGLPMELKK